jgi:hypothetical protein
MANVLYDKGRAKLVAASIDWLTDGIKVSSVRADLYVPDFVNDEYLSDILSIAVTGTSPPLAGKTFVADVADALDTRLPNAFGELSEYLVIYNDTGDRNTSSLLAFIDTATGTWPLVPNGEDVDIIWNNGSSKIFKIGSPDEVGIPKVIRHFAPEQLEEKLALVCPDNACTCTPNLQAYVAKPTVLYLESLHFRTENGVLCQ